MNLGNYVIVNIECLPDVFKKVLETKKLLETGRQKNIQDAVNAVGISRSVYYKYKDSIFDFYEHVSGRSVTFSISLEDVPGKLATILNILADLDYNILSLNQAIPVNGIANITLTVETNKAEISVLQQQIMQIDGLRDFKILAGERG